MADEFVPQLGQMAFGQPWSEYATPSFVEAGLAHLATEIERVEWNIQHKQFSAPTGNNGGEYETPVFSMRAYYWGECTCGADESEVDVPHRVGCPTIIPNFKCGDFEVRWYKWMGRGMSMNQEIDANQFFEIIDKCIESVQRKEREHFKDDPDYGEPL